MGLAMGKTQSDILSPIRLPFGSTLREVVITYDTFHNNKIPWNVRGPFSVKIAPIVRVNQLWKITVLNSRPFVMDKGEKKWHISLLSNWNANWLKIPQLITTWYFWKSRGVEALLNMVYRITAPYFQKNFLKKIIRNEPEEIDNSVMLNA